MQEKFEKLETELREEVGVLKAQAPPRFSEVVARSRREQTLTVANLQQQEPETGLAPRLEGRRRVGRKGDVDQTKNICDKARRTIGFYKICEEDISRMYGESVPFRGAAIREQAPSLAVYVKFR